MLHSPRSFRLVAPAIVGVLALTLSACSGGGGNKNGAGGDPKKAAAVVKTSDLKLGAVAVQSAGPPLVPVDSATRAAALAVAQQYLDTGVNAPLKDGTVAPAYANLFDAPLRAAATGADAAALTDADVGKIDGFTETTTPVALTGLADQTGALIYLAPSFTVNIVSTSAANPLKIARSVELTLAPTADKHWNVIGYRVLAVRKGPTGTTTTTAATGSTP